MLLSKPRFPIKEIVLFGFLPGPVKKFFYRLKGYKIGKNVKLGLGSVVSGEEVTLGDHSCLGFLTIIRGKTIRIGSHVSIGAMTIIDTPHLEIGSGTKINEQVFVGGLQTPDSRLVLGRNCQIMQMSFINPARSITIGDDTGIGGDSLIFGHTSWLSRFEGYPVEFEPIEIGNSVSLAWRVFVLPGTRIGDGAVIGANSLVHRTVPPRCLAVGFPARVVSKAPDFPQEVNGEQKVEILKHIVTEMVDFWVKSGLECRSQEDRIEVTQTKKGWGGSSRKAWRLQVQYEPLKGEEVFPGAADLDVLLSLQEVPPDLRRSCEQRRIMWIDIEKKEQPNYWNDLGEEVAQYLKRYGVRLFRVPE
jgi:acetyltransferase-like isoleucine patch superfamily enzyme